MTLAVQDEVSGYVTSTLQIQGGSVPLVGFTDVYAKSGERSRQGLTVSALLQDGSVAGLAGSLDFASGILSVACLQSQGAVPDFGS